MDLTPTVLYLLGEPVPEGLDGQPMTPVIDPAFLEANPLQHGPPLEEDFRELTPEEIRNRKSLPYIGG